MELDAWIFAVARNQLVMCDILYSRSQMHLLSDKKYGTIYHTEASKLSYAGVSDHSVTGSSRLSVTYVSLRTAFVFS